MAMPANYERTPDSILDYEDIPEKRIMRIEGINYSYELLKAFGQDGFPIGAILKIIERDGDTVTVERMYELEEKK